MTGQVVIDSAGGELRVGDRTFPIADALPAGAIRLLPPDGPVLRAISFGERYRLVERASVASDPVETLCASIAGCATVLPAGVALSAAEESLCQTLALALAGADIEAPVFADAMLLVGGRSGWSYADIEAAEAARVDRLARRLQPQQPEDDDGWNRMVFQTDPVLELEAVRRSLAGRLLERLGDELAIEQEMDGRIPVVDRSGSPGQDRSDARALDGDPARPAAWNASGPVATQPAESARSAGTLLSGLAGDIPAADHSSFGRDGATAGTRARVLGYSLAPRQPREPGALAVDDVPGGMRAGSVSPAPEDAQWQGGGHRGDDAGRSSWSGTAGAAAGARPDGMPAPAIETGSPWNMRSAMPSRGSATSARFAPGDGNRQWGAAEMRAVPGDISSPLVPGYGAGSTGEHGFPVPSGIGQDRPAAAQPPAEHPFPPYQEHNPAATIMELADALAELLHEEADLRGIDR